MILSRLPEVKREHERKIGRRVTYDEIKQATGLAASTTSRLMSAEPIDRIDGRTLDALCGFFDCTVGDLLEFRKDTP